MCTLSDTTSYPFFTSSTKIIAQDQNIDKRFALFTWSSLCVFSFLFVFTYDTLRDVSGDMHHPRHRFITAVGTRTTRTSPRSFLVSARHNCLSLSVSVCLSVLPPFPLLLSSVCLSTVCSSLCVSVFLAHCLNIFLTPSLCILSVFP